MNPGCTLKLARAHKKLADGSFDSVGGDINASAGRTDEIGRACLAAPLTALRTPDNCNPGGGIGRNLKLPSPEKANWVELIVKFAPTYKTAWEGPSCTAPDHKFIFWKRLNSREGSTWRFKVGQQCCGFGLPECETENDQKRRAADA